MKNSRTKFLIIFLTIFVVGVTTFILYQENIINTGTEVILKTMPRDPRDILRGDYVVLRYEIGGGKEVQEILNKKSLQEGQKVYVLLEVDSENIATVQDVMVKQPSKGSLYLIGEVVKSWGNKMIKYSTIEQYFVPEGKGKKVERMRKLEVVVSIKDGKALIKHLVNQGKILDFSKN